MKSVLLVVVSLLCFQFNGFNQKEERTIEFEYSKSEDPNPEFPRLEIDEGDWVIPIVEMQGVLVGYAKSHDYEAYFDLSVSDSWDIWVYVENKTGKDIVYNNPNEWVASIKFPGQETYYKNKDQTSDISRVGGRCPFTAYMLDKENGQYVMKAGKSYNWAYTIYRDVDNIALQVAQKFFRPLFVETLVPSSANINKEPDLISYKETTSTKKISKDIELTSSRHRLDLPKEYVFLSPYFTSYKLKTPFKKDGQYDIIYDDGSLRIGLREINSNGEFECQTKNLGMQKISTVGMDPFASLYFNEGAKIDIRLSKNKMNARYLVPGEVYTKSIKVELPHPSGEVYIKNEGFSPR